MSMILLNHIFDQYDILVVNENEHIEGKNTIIWITGRIFVIAFCPSSTFAC